MNFDFNIFFNSISTVCLIIATIFTCKNYLFFKILENENHFYKYKMESAQRLLVASMTLINQFQDIMSTVFDLQEQNKFDTEAKNLIDTKIDFNFDEFRKSVIKDSLFLPKSILNEIVKFYDMFFEEINFSGTEEDIEQYFDGLLDKIESISELIRQDLGVENLNIKLKRRIR